MLKAQILKKILWIKKMNFKIKIFAKELIKKKRRLRMKQLQLKIKTKTILLKFPPKPLIQKEKTEDFI
jgi:hypothetical protein